MEERARGARRWTDRLLWGVLAAVLLAVIILGVQRLVRRPAERLPILGEVAAFELVERSGIQVSASDLRGRVWVADFVFTRCGGICPVLSAAMQRLQAELAARGATSVRLVSFTVDPAYDTPEVLRAYAARFDADPERWLFLGGERAAIYRLVRDGFMLAVAEAEPGGEAEEGELVTHSDRLVVIDDRMRIRAYHHGGDRAAVAAVLDDVLHLLERGGS